MITAITASINVEYIVVVDNEKIYKRITQKKAPIWQLYTKFGFIDVNRHCNEQLEKEWESLNEKVATIIIVKKYGPGSTPLFS